MCRRLQPRVVEAATLCSRCAWGTWRRTPRLASGCGPTKEGRTARTRHTTRERWARVRHCYRARAPPRCTHRLPRSPPRSDRSLSSGTAPLMAVDPTHGGSYSTRARLSPRQPSSAAAPRRRRRHRRRHRRGRTHAARSQRRRRLLLLLVLFLRHRRHCRHRAQG